ncbi:hypothetical protein AY599_10000 [Leptolyngbya valderiana BDU 20041]|nr:hypothetical protein AY599_10000 [Leptolyngbya valderiana BDU 20041]PPT09296.1 hypothetical protein CKA32_006054 [Geitlerinema sp. FC II]
MLNSFFDLAALAELSRIHCVGICAVLVPSNLLATLATMVLTAIARSPRERWMSAGIASLLAVAMVLHVWTWFAIGVVRVPTFVLLALASLCLGLNSWAVFDPQTFVKLYRWGKIQVRVKS